MVEKQELADNDILSLIHTYHAKIEEMKRELAKLEQEAQQRNLL